MAKRQTTRQTAAEWAREVAAWRRSGLTAAAFASRRRLKASTLTWWAWKLRRDADPQEGRELALVAVEVVDEADAAEVGGGWELVTAAGHRLRGDGVLTPEAITALVGALVGGR
jgi:hypothetical protein